MDTKSKIAHLVNELAGLIHDGEGDAAFVAIKNTYLANGTYVTRWTAADVQAYGDITPEQAREIVTSDTFREVMENGELFDDIIGTVVFESGF